jgi:hypothetical protein
VLDGLPIGADPHERFLAFTLGAKRADRPGGDHDLDVLTGERGVAAATDRRYPVLRVNVLDK